MSHRLAAVVATVISLAWSTTQLQAQGTPPGTRPTGPAAGGAAAPPSIPSGGGALSPSASKGASPAGTSVVVIDIGEVFKQHAQFNKQLATLKEEIKNLDSFYQGEQRKVAQKRDQLSTFSPGSPEYKKHEEEVARMISDLQVEMQLKQKNIAEQEAKVYYATYLEIYKYVEDFADRYGIGLVLRHNNIQMDPQKRDTVLQGVNRPIVFQRRLDITDEIIKRVNGGVAAKPAPAVPPRGTTTR